MKNEKERFIKNKNSRFRIIVVLAFLLVFAFVSYVNIRGDYLEYKELGDNFIQVLTTNYKYKYSIMIINFIFLYFVMYFTTRGIKKGLNVFFEQEKIEMPKLPNKSISLIISSIVSVVLATILTPKILLFTSGAAFGITDRVFNLDISYYMFIKPVITIMIIYYTSLMIFLSVYMIIYYIIVFNMKFNGIERETLKESILMKKLIRNARMIAIRSCFIYIIWNSKCII